MRQQFYRMENPMTYKMKSLFTLTCLSVALLGASFGVINSVKAEIIEAGYEYQNENGREDPFPYFVGRKDGYARGLRDGAMLFTFDDDSKNNKFPRQNPTNIPESYKEEYEKGFREGYNDGHTDGIANSRRNYPFLSLIGDTWSWAESWFK